MLVAIIILSILLLLSLTFIVLLGKYLCWKKGEWLTMLCFIFCFPLWVILKIVFG